MRFTTLFINCPNYGLAKDVGQIPYVLNKNYDDMEATLVSSQLDLKGDEIKNVDGLTLVKPLFIVNEYLTGIIYLLRNSKQIDWLNVYHCGRKAYIWAKVFKWCNPKGKTYLKLDLDYRSCDMYDSNQAERSLFKKVTEEMDLVTVESEVILKRIQKYTDKNIKVITNGYCTSDMPVEINKPRLNTFLTVGRLGTEQKATDLLMEAFAQTANDHDWNLKLIGTIEDSFRPFVKEYFEKHPNLKGRVEFLGSISDRKSLYEEYCKAKVFVLPSRWESFALVGAEAISCGCRTIISDAVPTSSLITGSGRYGTVIPANNIEKLADALIHEVQLKGFDDVNTVTEISEYANTIFSWENICAKLYKEMKDEDSQISKKE